MKKDKRAGENNVISIQRSMDPKIHGSKDPWILSSETIFQLNQLFSNSEAAMLSATVFYVFGCIPKYMELIPN